jgi:tRNA nucleotidyltransferase/poly(A) polymerase
MARKEVGYIPGTRTPIIYPGTLYDDLSRRDFTVNALAKDPDTGEIVDYFNGMKDIWGSIIRTPLDPVKTFDDDPLRILRAIRFAITKRFTIADDAWRAMRKYDYFDKMSVVSEERIREELTKCFKYNTLGTLRYLSQLPELEEYIFKKTNLWLKPTNEK